MGRKGWLLSLAAAGAIAVAIALAVSPRHSGGSGAGSGLVPGQIYAVDAGDPIDLVYGIDESGMGCMHLRGLALGVGGIPYGGGTRCFDLEEVEQGGTYQIVLPASAEDPALVVGVTPFGTTRATVSGVGWTTAPAVLRGRWFLASLEPTSPDVSNLDDFRVRFEY